MIQKTKPNAIKFQNFCNNYVIDLVCDINLMIHFKIFFLAQLLPSLSNALLFKSKRF